MIDTACLALLALGMGIVLLWMYVGKLHERITRLERDKS